VAATGWLIRRRFARHWPALLPLVLVVAIGGAGALLSLGAADRTDTAYADYLDRSGASDVVINPSLHSADIGDAIRKLPGVRRVTSDALFLVTAPDDGEPRTVAEFAATEDESTAQIRGSADGRYTAMDRPAVEEGRLPTGRREAFVNRELARSANVKVGDTIPTSFWNGLDDPILTAQLDEPPAPDSIVEPIGVEQLTVVGIGTFGDEVLPDGLYPQDRMIVSPDVADRYDCVPEAPPTDATYEESLSILLPDGCATSYEYYALDVPGGPRAVGAALDAYARRADQLDAELPQPLLDRDVRYILISTTTKPEQERVDRSTRPTVGALLVLGLIAAAVTAAIGAIVVARELRRRDEEHLQWYRLGMGARERAAVLGVPPAVAIVVGVAIALFVAWLLSPIAPVGNVRSVDPSPARTLPSWALYGAVAVTALLLLTLGFLVARSVVRHRTARVRRPSSTWGRFVPRRAGPEVSEGVRAAYGGGGGTGLVVGSAVVACTVFLAAIVFGTSLSSLVSTPAAYGWPWDVGSMGGFGYGGLDVAKMRADLDGQPGVERWAGLGFTAASLDSEPTPTLIALGGSSDVDLGVVEGRLPSRAREVALGTRTAAERGIEVGDTVRLGGDGLDTRRARVTGLAVLPTLGPYGSDRAAPGDGMLVPAAAFDPEFVNGVITFAGVDLASGPPGPEEAARLTREYQAWDTNGYVPFLYPEPVRPAEIDDAESMQGVPLLVGGLLVVATVIGLAVAIVLSVRSRRRELAMLRALGFDARQVRSSVRVQSLATVIPAIAIGVPGGIVLGRFLWQSFASELGVLQTVSVPVVWVVATVVGAVVVALVASAVPARVAARIAPATALRAE
jgi:hypothetical protein